MAYRLGPIGEGLAYRSEPMPFEILLHCADPDAEWLYNPDGWMEESCGRIPSILDPLLDFEHPWFEHHERGLNRTVHLNRAPTMDY